MARRVIESMTRRVMTYDRSMRWEPGARERLQRAAFELFAEHGYAATSVPEITRRAGLTTRTFFRYFADKREVIFGGDEIPVTAAALIRAAPADLEPMAVVRVVLHQVAEERFGAGRAETAAWRRIIDADDSLRDRDARKRADLVRAARDAFVDRGEAPLSATLAAEVGAMAFHVAMGEWVRDAGPDSMTDAIDEVLDRLTIASPSGHPPLQRNAGSRAGA